MFHAAINLIVHALKYFNFFIIYLNLIKSVLK